MKKVGQGILELLIENGFGTYDSVTLTFDLVTSKSIGFLRYPGWMCGLSLRKVGQGVLELLNGNKKVTDGGLQTDRHVQPNMPSL